MGVAVSGGRARRADERAFRAANRLADERVDAAASAITELGSIWASAGGAAVLAAGGHRRAAVRGLAAAGVTWLAGQGLKRLFERPRPYQADADGTRLLIGPPSAASWPSSHPAVLLSFVEVVGRELGWRARHAPRSSARRCRRGLRVIVGVHPGDVAGGLLLGRAVAEGVARNGRQTPPVPLATIGWPVLDRIHLFGDFAISPHGIGIAIGVLFGADLERRGPKRGVRPTTSTRCCSGCSSAPSSARGSSG